MGPAGARRRPASPKSQSATSVVDMRTAIVVPGNGGRRLARNTGISAACLALVREAERLADSTPIDVVVFTGGSRGSGLSEAELAAAALCRRQLRAAEAELSRISAL